MDPDTTSSTCNPRPGPAPLRELARLFIRLGLTAFGGPAAHIALMEEEVVRRRKWMDRATFLDLVGICNLLPGPNSTEMAIHIGFTRAGWPGLLVAGLGFIVPAVLVTLTLAWTYVRFGTLPGARGLLAGIQPVILAILAQAIWNLGRTALKRPALGCLGAAVLALSVLGIPEALLILGAGAVSLALARPRGLPAILGATALPGAGAAVGAIPFSLGGLFWVFLKAGSVLFGSGYVLVAFLRTDLVHRLHWLSESQLLDAVAAGQVTPGPVFTTATFIGYLLGSWQGALAATVGIFLPAFVLVGLSAFLVPRIRRSPSLSAFQDGVNAAAVALMASVLWDLGRAALLGLWTAALALGSAVLLVRLRINPPWLVAAGALAGLLFQARAG